MLFELKLKAVGYLSKENARQYRKQMKNNTNFEMNSKCSAKILGGWNRSDNTGNYGVKLDITLTSQEFDEPKDLSLLTEFHFLISHPNAQELVYPEVGEYVNFWSPPDDSAKIIIFRQGSAMGGGRLGLVPQKYALLIQKHEELGLPIETEISEITNASCTIRCRLIQENEVRNAKELWQKQILSELDKVYLPRKPLTISVEASLDMFKVDEKLTFKLNKLPNLDSFVKDPYGYAIIFTSLDGSKSAVKLDEFRVKMKIIRLTKTYNSLNIEVISQVDNVYDKKSKYTLLVTPDNL